MTYADLAARLQELGFTRVERDDRLLDIFPAEQRDKGSELWEVAQQPHVYLVRISEPYNIQRLELFAVPAAEIEQALISSTSHQLDQYELHASTRRLTKEWVEAMEKLIKQPK